MGVQRHAHYWKRSVSDGGVSSLVAVYVHTEAATPAGETRLHRNVACAFGAMSARIENGRATRQKTLATTDECEFWSFVKAACRTRGHTWLFGWQLAAQLAAAGLYERIEDGTLQLSDDPFLDAGRQDVAPKRRRHGYIVLENPPTIIAGCFNGQAGKFTMVDCRNYGVEAFAEMAEPDDASYSVPPEPWDTEKHKKEHAYYRAGQVFDWSMRWVRLVTEHKLGLFRATAGSQAMTAYKRSHLNELVLVHDNRDALDIERAAYFGGRVEAFRLGTIAGRVFHYDVNSLYPFVAASNLMPARLHCVGTGQHPIAGLHVHQRYLPIAEVEVDMREPAVPYRYEGRLLFPVGTFTTTLCGPELRLAAEHGTIRKVGRVAWYEPASLFRSYVDALYELKLRATVNGDQGDRNVWKSLLNALWGKIGQRAKRWIDCPEIRATAPYGEWWGAAGEDGQPIRYRSLGWNVQKYVEVGEHRESCPAIAAYINSLARAFLWRWIRPMVGRGLVYTDTDSAMFTDEGRQHFPPAASIDDWKLGDWREVGVYKSLTIRGIKHYVADGRRVCAGVPADAAELSPGVYEWCEPVHPIQSGRLTDYSGSASHTKREFKPLSYRHGVVGEGGVVRPLSMSHGVPAFKVTPAGGELNQVWYQCIRCLSYAKGMVGHSYYCRTCGAAMERERE